MLIVIAVVIFIILDPILYAVSVNKYPELIQKKKIWIPFIGFYYMLWYVILEKPRT